MEFGEAGQERSGHDPAGDPEIGWCERGVPLLVETTAEGAILLRPTVVHPIEIYSDQRVEEFEHENAVPDDLQERVHASLKQDG